MTGKNSEQNYMRQTRYCGLNYVKIKNAYRNFILYTCMYI